MTMPWIFTTVLVYNVSGDVLYLYNKSHICSYQRLLGRLTHYYCKYSVLLVETWHPEELNRRQPFTTSVYRQFNISVQENSDEEIPILRHTSTCNQCLDVVGM